MDDIIWEAPPQAALDAQTVARSTYGEFALALRDRPNEWAKVPRVFASNDSARNTATNMRRGHVKGFVKGEYETIAHETQIWARFIGPKDGQDAPATPAPPRAPRKQTVATPSPAPKDLDEGDDGSASPDETMAFPARVRVWAKLNGFEVAAHGRLPSAVIEAYERDTQDYRPGELKIVR